MRSAYVTLGVPGNASIAEIELAFEQAMLRQKNKPVTGELELEDDFADICNAYKVLRDPDQRAAHDQRLNSMALPAPPRRRSAPPMVITVEKTSGPNWTMIVIVLMVLAFAGMFMLQSSREKTRQQELKLASEKARLQAEAESRAWQEQLDQQQQEQEQARARAKAAQDAERQARDFRRDAEMAADRAKSLESQQENAMRRQQQQAMYEERRRQSDARSEEQRRLYEAQQRAAADRAAIRNLCYQNYRRWDC